jgi:NADP-dependent 3-hydroxy acid dehydrogenase YdfG
MSALQIDLPDMLRHNQVNYVGALNLLDAVLPHLLAQP